MDTRDIFAKAVRRAKVNGVSEFDRYGVIVFLENEIDMYRDKIAKLLDEKTESNSTSQLETVQESTVAEIIKALSDNGYNISINLFKNDESEE
jgi:hypothetical protein